MASGPRIELLSFEGCPSREPLLGRLRGLIVEAGGDPDALVLRHIDSVEQARAERFLGSPTVLVDGRDVDPTAAGRDDYGLSCRIYRWPGGSGPTPPDSWISDALFRD